MDLNDESDSELVKPPVLDVVVVSTFCIFGWLREPDTVTTWERGGGRDVYEDFTGRGAEDVFGAMRGNENIRTHADNINTCSRG